MALFLALLFLLSIFSLKDFSAGLCPVSHIYHKIPSVVLAFIITIIMVVYLLSKLLKR